MKKLILVIFQTVIMLVSFCLLSFADNSARIVDQANRLYRQKQFDQAIKLYNQAQIKAPDSAEINYNIGIAWFKKEDYNSAISFLEKATASKDKILESKANYNIANAKYKLGRLKENTDLKETVNLLRQSLDYYKRAIELDPKDQDAKINHELVEKELKALLDKLKQEQDKQKDQSEKKETQEQNQQQGQKEQQGNKEEHQDQQQAEGQQNQEKNGQQNDKQEQAKKEEAKAGDKQEQDKQAREQQSGQQAEQQKPEDQDQQAKEQQDSGQVEDEKKMSKEEADMLLEGYRQEENTSGMLKDERQGREAKVLKDW
jgi:Ca-activated chloride channel homolog